MLPFLFVQFLSYWAKDFHIVPPDLPEGMHTTWTGEEGNQRQSSLYTGALFVGRKGKKTGWDAWLSGLDTRLRERWERREGKECSGGRREGCEDKKRGERKEYENKRVKLEDEVECEEHGKRKGMKRKEWERRERKGRKIWEWRVGNGRERIDGGRKSGWKKKNMRKDKGERK